MRPVPLPRPPLRIALNASSRATSHYIFPPSLISVLLARPRIITSTTNSCTLPSSRSLSATRAISSPRHRRPPMPVPVSPGYAREHDTDALGIAIATSDMSLSDHSPFLSFEDAHSFDAGANDSNNMIFDFDDQLNFECKRAMQWSPSSHQGYSMSSALSIFDGSPESTTSQLDFGAAPAHLPPGDRSYTSGMLGGFSDVAPPANDFNYSHWIADPDLPAAAHPPTSAPIDIPLSPSHSSAASSFAGFSDNSSIFPDVTPFSPTAAYAALQPLPRSFSPGQDASDATGTLRPRRTPAVSFTASDASSLSPPMWASQLFTPPSHPAQLVGSPTYPSSPLSEDAYATQRPRTHSRRSIAPVADVFHSSSAPSPSHMRPPYTRAFSSRRSESIGEHDDRDATVRRKKRSFEEDEEDHRAAEKDTKSEGERHPHLSSTRNAAHR